MELFNQIVVFEPDPISIDGTMVKLLSTYIMIRDSVGFDNEQMLDHIEHVSVELQKNPYPSREYGMEQATQLLATVGLQVIEAIIQQARDKVSKDIAESN